MNKRLLAGLAVALLFALQQAIASTEQNGPLIVPGSSAPGATAEPMYGDGLDVPYVPTGDNVVAEMLTMAKVGKDDFLCDLGCGDGRIVITAAKKFGTRGFGVDLNPRRIKESEENARAAGVQDKVKFYKQDLFATDISKASVVTMYLLPSVNLKLRPRLFKELKPGTRIVSHDFDMGDWRPDQVSRSGLSATVYYWVIPANVSGKWTWNDGNDAYALDLEQEFQDAKGTLAVNGKTKPLKDVKLNGDRFSFSVDGADGTAEFSGKVDGDRITGTSKGDRQWQAQRDAATKKDIDPGTAARTVY